MKTAMQSQFEVEAEAFARLLPTLFAEYEGRFVAIYEGRVVANGINRLTVWREVREQWGVDAVCYTEQVRQPSMRKARITSVWTRHS